MYLLFLKIRHLPFYMLLMVTMGISGLERLFPFGVPDWFINQFSGSIIDVFPAALTVAWVAIVVLQLMSFTLVTVAVMRGEFLDGTSKKWTFPAFFMAEIVFVALGFGQRLTHQYEPAFWLFAYAVLTYLAAGVILGNHQKVVGNE